MLRPRHADQHLEAVIVGEIEQPERRRGEDANRVDADLGHQREIALGDLAFRELAAMRACREGPVGHAFDEELFVAAEKEFALNANRHATRGGARAFLRDDGSESGAMQPAAPCAWVPRVGAVAKRF